ncbi:MAG TPA: hypothetical protein VK934_07550 [Fimbriimonas sp.]|nr:hypothetical protein [Fimbriimonas sp.]
MLTLGDVWAITAVIVGVAVCAWAFLLCLALVFPRRTEFARAAIEFRPGKQLLIGFIVTAIASTLGVMLLSAPNGVIKLFGWIVLLGLTAISFTGTAGLVSLAGERVQRLDHSLSGYGSLSRGALFVVLPAVMPLLGWFLYAPVVFCIGVGAGLKAIGMKEPVPVAVPVEA